MNKNITISFTIPLSDEEWAGPSICFYRWIPEKDSDVIVINNDNSKISIYIDKKCVSSLHEVTDERINSWANISVSKLKVEVLLNNIEADVANFIYDERESPREIHHGLKPGDDNYEELEKRYKDLGFEASKLAISAFNRVISYARNTKGQYWLTELKIDKNRQHNFDVKFNAKSKIDDGDWFRWCPPYIDCITIYSENDESVIKEGDWGSISEYVQNNNRPNLTFELLANARYLFASEHMRSSVIEAVTALEVSVSKFGSNANIEMLSKIIQTDRVDIDNIGNQIKHLGFSGSIRYLIPLLLGEEILQVEILEKCYKAIEVRNNVIHQGQRDVSSELVREVLNGVSECCRILNLYTLST